MLSIFTRTVIMYLLLIFIMRILGKRQLGELEISELITTILLSEIASLPITNQDVSILQAAIPLVTIMVFEIATSILLMKIPRLKGILSSRPSTLIKHGEIDQRELSKNRISSEELISELRLNNITDPKNVEYAILEQNGLLSVIPKAEFQQPTLRQLSLESNESGIMHIIISQGFWNDYNIQLLKKNKNVIDEQLKKRGIAVKDVFLLLIDDSENYNIILKEETK